MSALVEGSGGPILDTHPSGEEDTVQIIFEQDFKRARKAWIRFNCQCGHTYHRWAQYVPHKTSAGEGYLGFDDGMPTCPKCGEELHSMSSSAKIVAVERGDDE